jgi:hypothetical protein
MMTHHSNQPTPPAARVFTGAARRPLILLLASALLFLLGGSGAAAAAQPHTFTEFFGSPGTGAGQFAFTSESGLAIDQSNGDLYLADTGNHRVEKFSPTGAFLFAFGWGVKAGDTSGTGLDTCTTATKCQAGFPGHEPGQFEEPTFIAVDNTPGGNGDVYVANNGAVGNERQTVTVSGAGGGEYTLYMGEGSASFGKQKQRSVRVKCEKQARKRYPAAHKKSRKSLRAGTSRDRPGSSPYVGKTPQ